jgi:hypothetical protein
MEHVTQVGIAGGAADLGALRVRIAPVLTPSQKLGQPVPESNLVALLNSSASQQTQWYIPAALWFQ